MNVPFLDLKKQYEGLRDEIEAAISDVIQNCAFAGGPFVKRFEDDFAGFCRSKYATGVSSGTEALWLVMLALGIGPQDEVITVPNTFIATAEAISFCGATPVFVDVDAQTFTMNPNLLEEAITPRTRAIIPVHLYGQPADMNPIMEIARQYELFVIEDACQAQGAEYNGQRAGTIGHAGCFSFYPGKNLGAYGEAGAVITDDPKLDETIRMLRDHGQTEKYKHSLIGWNARMAGIQGAVLSVKLRYLETWNALRRKNAGFYRECIEHFNGVKLPVEAPYARHIYHIFPLHLKNRDKLMAHLAEKGVQCGIHYPVPVHLQEAYRYLGLKEGMYPVSEKSADEQLSLPMFPELTQEHIEFVAEQIKHFIS